MTREEFLAELAKTPRTWAVGQKGRLRCVNGDCPITAVYRLRDPNHALGPERFDRAAEAMRSAFDEYAIAEAADNGWEAGLTDELKAERADLLKACGLA